MPCQLLNISKNLLINFNKIKKQKTKLKTIKYINSDLIHFEQEHNHRFKHQHKNIKHKPRTKHKKTQTQI